MNTIKLNTRLMKMNTKLNDKVVSGKVVVALLTVIASISVAISPLFAAFSEKDAGTRTAQFLKLPVGARYIGMGEAGTAIADDANAMFYNVAGLARLEKKSGEGMWAPILLKDKVDGESNPGQYWIAYAMPISEQIGSAGIALQGFYAGDINETDQAATKIGTFSPYDVAVNLAYARKVADIPVGLDLKIISSKIKESATTVAVDLGAQYTKLMEGKMMLGFAVQNLGGQMKFETENSKLPILIKLGSGYKIMDNLLVAADIVFPEDNSAYLGIGSEYNHKLNEEMNLAGRLGYNSRNRKVDGFNGLTFGAGVGFKMASFDLAWMPMGDLGQTLKFSVGVKF